MKMWALTLEIDPTPERPNGMRETVYIKANSIWQALERARAKDVDISKVIEARFYIGRAL